jgi:hypothetical protein
MLAASKQVAPHLKTMELKLESVLRRKVLQVKMIGFAIFSVCDWYSSLMRVD